jgi:hypothetical protein
MLQIILLSFSALIAIVLIAAFFMKKDYSISASTVINRPRNDVFNYVKILKNQENYSKWVMADPNSKLNYIGEDGTIGFISQWESELKNVGIGEQEIMYINENDSYQVEIRFKKPFEGVSQAITTTEAISDNQTKVTTTFLTSTPFPMNVMVPFISKMLKKDMDGNMSRLKANLEA